MRTTIRAFLTLVMVLGTATGTLLWAADYATAETDANDLRFYRPAVTTAPYPLTSADRVRNVILCIGDGMGVSHVALANLKANGVGGKLHMERLPVAGLVRTHSADSLVTDSAASGTAMACGVKTDNGMIGMTPDGQAWCTLLELAQDKGMATGLIATSTITHATPASFGAHVKSRKMEDRIAEHLVANRINVIFGGGRKYFLPQADPNSGRKDDTDLIAQARQADYMVITTASELQSIRYPYMLGLFQLDALTTVEPEPCLAMLTEQAIDALQHANPTSTGQNQDQPGFFLMVEGSQIDWAGHSNDDVGVVRQTLLFDQAVEKAVDFALREGNTLVIVTSDHETGGLTLTTKHGTPVPNWSTKGHSGTPVPIWALGPGAEHFAGVQDNTDIPKKIARLLDIRPFPRPKP